MYVAFRMDGFERSEDVEQSIQLKYGRRRTLHLFRRRYSSGRGFMIDVLGEDGTEAADTSDQPAIDAVFEIRFHPSQIRVTKHSVKTSGTTTIAIQRMVGRTSRRVPLSALEPNIYLDSDQAKATVMFYAGSYTRYSSALFDEISDLFVNNQPKSI